MQDVRNKERKKGAKTISTYYYYRQEILQVPKDCTRRTRSCVEQENQSPWIIVGSETCFGENLQVGTNKVIQCGANLARLMLNIRGLYRLLYWEFGTCPNGFLGWNLIYVALCRLSLLSNHWPIDCNLDVLRLLFRTSLFLYFSDYDLYIWWNCEPSMLSSGTEQSSIAATFNPLYFVISHPPLLILFLAFSPPPLSPFLNVCCLLKD